MPKHVPRNGGTAERLVTELAREIHTHGIKQNFIASKANVIPQYLSRMLNMQANPSLGIMSEVGAVLGLELVWKRKVAMKWFMWKRDHAMRWTPRFEPERKEPVREEKAWYSSQFEVPETMTLDEAIKLYPPPN